MTIKDIEAGIGPGIYTSKEVKDIIRTAIKSAFEATRVEEKEIDNLKFIGNEDDQITVQRDMGHNEALTEQDKRQEEYLK